MRASGFCRGGFQQCGGEPVGNAILVAGEDRGLDGEAIEHPIQRDAEFREQGRQPDESRKTLRGVSELALPVDTVQHSQTLDRP